MAESTLPETPRVTFDQKQGSLRAIKLISEISHYIEVHRIPFQNGSSIAFIFFPPSLLPSSLPLSLPPPSLLPSSLPPFFSSLFIFLLEMLL